MESDDTKSSLVKLYTFFILMFQTVFKISDTAINVLFSFFALFFATIARTKPTVTHSFAGLLPMSKHVACSRLSSGKQFTRYVCCPACHSIYNRKECIILGQNGHSESKHCSFQKYPNHPQTQHRNECGHRLKKNVKSSTGTVSLYPYLIYCYKSVIESLAEMVSKPGFTEKCEIWRDRNTSDGVFTDVYDGNVWKDFMAVEGVGFLSALFNYGLHLNVDWFRHTQHSEGAIFISIKSS